MTLLQPIADRVAQHLEIIPKIFQFSTRRTRILMGFIVYYLVLIVNPMGRILVRWKSFRNNLEMLCHPICNWLWKQMYQTECVPVAQVQGGEDSQDPLGCRSFSTKEPLNIGQFCGKWPLKMRDPMSLRHFVCARDSESPEKKETSNKWHHLKNKGG